MNYKEMNHQELLTFIQETTDLKLLKEVLANYHEYDLAEVITELDEENLKKLAKVFSDEELGDIFTYIDSDDAAEVMEDLHDKKIADIISTMEPDDAIDIIQEFDEDKQEAIISHLDEEQKQEITELALYDEDTTGAIMNTNFISIKSGSDVKEIMKEIVQRAPDVESITTSFVVDEENKLLGTLNLKKIIITKSPAMVDDIMNTNFKFVETSDTLDHTIALINKYDIYELPVLENGVLKGIVTMDDALETFHEESEDDYIRFAGVSETAEIDETILLSVKNRLPWLVLLLFLNLIIVLVMSRFNHIFEAITILVVFQPILLDLAGNTGTQSLAITISAISKNELTTSKKVSMHLFKEFLLGLLSGLALSVISILIAYIVYSRVDPVITFTQLATTLAISVVASATFANVFGTAIPIFFYKIKIDPAAASGPLITTLVDIATILIYYLLATILIYNHLIN